MLYISIIASLNVLKRFGSSTFDLDGPNSKEAYSPRQIVRRVHGYTLQDGVAKGVRRKDGKAYK